MAELSFENLKDGQPQIVVDATAKRAYVMICLPIGDMLKSITEHVVSHADPSGALNKGIITGVVAALQTSLSGVVQSDAEIDANILEMKARKLNRPVTNTDDVIGQILTDAVAKREADAKAEVARAAEMKAMTAAREDKLRSELDAARAARESSKKA